jgi:hypothetical protein
MLVKAADILFRNEHFIVRISTKFDGRSGSAKIRTLGRPQASSIVEPKLAQLWNPMTSYGTFFEKNVTAPCG